MASREPRECTFLDDPAAYPEYAILVKRQSVYHALRQAFHRNRTVALLLVVAVSVAASGAELPQASLGADTTAKWGSFVAQGLNLHLLARHFEGVVSAVACTAAITMVSLLVHPLYRWTSSGSGEGRRQNALIAATVPSVLIWAIAVYGAGRCNWGVAAGLIVGLQSVGLTVKSISLVQVFSTLARRAPMIPARGSVNLFRKSSAPTSNGHDAPVSGEPYALAGSTNDPSGERAATSSDARDEASIAARGANGDSGDFLTFSQCAYFQMLVPSLVCDPRLVRPQARRKRDAARAASEFAHAALSYLAVHATCSAFFAPVCRALATAFDSAPADLDIWADERASGSGNWLHSVSVSLARGSMGAEGMPEVAEFSGNILGSQSDLMTVVVAALCGMLLLSPMMHFLMFYAFWHCICLGCAELWGYPDKNIYGPWWLVTDDLRDYFRTWSAPVYRWLATCVQRPMLDAGRRAAWRRRLRDDKNNGKLDGARGDGDRKSRPKKGDSRVFQRWWVASIICSFLVSGALHEAVGFIALRRTIWPFNTLFLGLSSSMTPWWDLLFPAVRPWPSSAAEGSGKMVPGRSEQKYHSAPSNGHPNPHVGSSGPNGKGDGLDKPASGCQRVDDAANRPPIGSFRGWFAIVFYLLASLPMTLMVDYLLWQWWRKTVMNP